jgi:hypothetical protein
MLLPLSLDVNDVSVLDVLVDDVVTAVDESEPSSMSRPGKVDWEDPPAAGLPLAVRHSPPVLGDERNHQLSTQMPALLLEEVTSGTRG